MKRSSLSLRGFAAVLTLLPGGLLPAAASAQQSFDDVEIRVHPVRGGVYYLEGRGGNIGLSVGEDGVVMIDDQFAQLTDRIVDAIREIDDGPIRFIINTHVHGDHVGGNANFARMGIDVLARDAVRRRLAEGGSPDAALPVLTYEEDIDIHLNDEEIVVFGVPPAHTDGDSYIHFRNADVIHAGDVFRTTGYPYIDRANGGTLAGTVDALGILIGLSGPETLIVPGHGGVSSREDVTAFRDMILDVRGRVEELVARGMSYEQVASANPTAPYDDPWGDPERFLRAIYEELTEG
ncbi:MAG: MBL fold metallo-hydrolase [Gemmatimonadota bacterium]